MKATAKIIDTPIGPFKAPLNPYFKDRLNKCNTDEDLFKLIDQNGFIDPDAFNEVLSRRLYGKYLSWKSKGENT